MTTENMTEEVNVTKEFVNIEATAIIEHSPNVTLANDELESFYKSIASKDHLIKTSLMHKPDIFYPGNFEITSTSKLWR